MDLRSPLFARASGYLVAIAATATAVLLRFILNYLGVQAPFFPFVLAVLVTAWYGGLKPGLMATVLGILLGNFLAQPLSSPNAIVTALFTVIGLVASLLSGSLHASRRRIEEKQQELKKTEERIRSVVDHVVDGIITIDAQGAIESFNPAAEKIFGYTATEVMGRNVKMLMPAPYTDQRDGYWSNFLRTSHAQINGMGRELEGIRKNGTTFSMDLAVSEFRIGAAQHFTGIVRDISERKQWEGTLKEADRRKDEFLATLAHELRNPLAPLRNGLELMRIAEHDSSLMEEVRNVMERQLGHMVRLIDDLLDVSRITTGKLQLRKEKVELSAIIRSAVETARSLIDDSEHHLTVTLPPLPIFLDADPTRLAQVFSNLLNNAAKYTEKGGHIWLSAEKQQAEVLVIVRDDGVGIAAEHLPHIFKTFSQVASALDRSQGGLGLGLSLASGVVELHQGSIVAHSAGAGQGSEFIVRLPIADMPLRMALPLDGDLEHANRHKKCRVLVVDDNRDTADTLAQIVRMMGHEVQKANDGLEAVQAAAAFHPDLVLLDIGLPKMNGYEAAQEIRKQPAEKNMILIALTGWGQEEDKRRALEAGFDHHLTKPVDPSMLRRLLSLVAAESSATTA